MKQVEEEKIIHQGGTKVHDEVSNVEKKFQKEIQSLNGFMAIRVVTSQRKSRKMSRMRLPN